MAWTGLGPGFCSDYVVTDRLQSILQLMGVGIRGFGWKWNMFQL